jgi:hypothetical protein
MPVELRLRHKKPEEIFETMGQDGPYCMMQLIRSPKSKLPADLSEGPFPTTEVALKVKEWMQSIIQAENDGAFGITEDRLVIELYSSRKINLDLIDLPGIVAGHVKGEPEDMSIQTRALSEQYLKEPHTLVVVVASNRSERIRNSQAFELVQHNNNMKMHAVGVLTMVDRCADNRRPDDPFWELKARLDGSSDDLPDLGGGYVALRNRDSSVPVGVTLEQSNAEELAWFKENLPGLHKNNRACTGVGDLVTKLLVLLETYTETVWAETEHVRLCSQHQGE